MGYQVALSPSAHRDLRDIVRYISADSKEKAVQFGRLLLTSTKRLTNFPEMGRVVPEIGDPNIREIIVRSYRVIYLVDHGDCRVDVLRFWHGARGTPMIDD
jgi:toxin ParE1/3/4